MIEDNVDKERDESRDACYHGITSGDREYRTEEECVEICIHTPC